MVTDGGEPRVWCAHCDESALEGTMVADFLRLHIASVRFIEATGRATGMYALLGWVSKRVGR